MTERTVTRGAAGSATIRALIEDAELPVGRLTSAMLWRGWAISVRASVAETTRWGVADPLRTVWHTTEEEVRLAEQGGRKMPPEMARRMILDNAKRAAQAWERIRKTNHLDD